jgi:small subunit ribosomal protein S17
MTKTRVVAVTRMTRHPKYLKYIKVTRRFMAHDEKNEFKKGDVVVIAEARPMSRGKRWTIVEKVTTGMNER